MDLHAVVRNNRDPVMLYAVSPSDKVFLNHDTILQHGSYSDTVKIQNISVTTMALHVVLPFHSQSVFLWPPFPL